MKATLILIMGLMAMTFVSCEKTEDLKLPDKNVIFRLTVITDRPVAQYYDLSVHALVNCYAKAAGTIDIDRDKPTASFDCNLYSESSNWVRQINDTTFQLDYEPVDGGKCFGCLICVRLRGNYVYYPDPQISPAVELSPKLVLPETYHEVVEGINEVIVHAKLPY